MLKGSKLFEISFSKPVYGIVFSIPFFFIGCGLLTHNLSHDDCKIHTYLSAPPLDYLTTQYGSEKSARIGIMPFDVPAGFSRWGKEEPSYGQELASKFQLEMQQTGQLGLIELFNVDSWPGKREEFFTGNYRALELGRKAGYEMILVGQLQIPRGEDTMVLYTKLIDVQNGVTAWSAQTTLTSDERDVNKRLAKWGVGKDKPEQFDFPRRNDTIVQCTVAEMLRSPEQKIKEQEEKKRAPSGAMDDSM